MFNNKTILITGGTGSFGKKIIKRLLNDYKPKKIIIYSRDELKQYNLQSELFKFKKQLRFFIGDVRDLPRLKKSFEKVNYVIHAAALKHVPVAEYNPFEYIKTNVFGAQNITECALENNVKKVIFLSTDKAVSPINLYGASKLCADKIALASNNYKGNNKCTFSVVRYGNVTASRGSVIPFFKEKLRNKELLTVTDKRMTRFNISLIDGVEMVLWSLNNTLGAEILVPKIPSYNLIDVVKAFGVKKFKIHGIRPGEKIHEELINVEESLNTIDIGNYYVVRPDQRNLNYSNYINKGLNKKIKIGEYNSNNTTQLSNIQLKKILLNLEYIKNYL